MHPTHFTSFLVCLVVPGPSCDNWGKRRGGVAAVLVVRGRAPRDQSLRDPPLARGARFACPLLRLRPFLSGCGGLPPVQASGPGLLVRIIQGYPQTLTFCLLMPIFPKLWLVAPWQPAGEVWRCCARFVAHCLLHVAAWGSELRAVIKSGLWIYSSSSISDKGLARI